MGTLLQPEPTTPEESSSNWLPIAFGVVLVAAGLRMFLQKG